jgi:hypothetical protein
LDFLRAKIQRLIELRGWVGITLFILTGVDLIDSVLDRSAEVKPPSSIGACNYAIRINEGGGLFGDVDCRSGKGFPSSLTTVPVILPSTGVGSGV